MLLVVTQGGVCCVRGLQGEMIFLKNEKSYSGFRCNFVRMIFPEEVEKVKIFKGEKMFISLRKREGLS